MAINFPSFNPVAFHIYGNISITWYGICWAISIFMISLYMCFLDNSSAKRYKNKFIFHSYEDVLEIVTFTFIFTIIGAKIMWLITHYKSLINDPLLMLASGGFTSFGALLGGYSALYYISFQKNIFYLNLWDLASCSIPICLFGVRIGNFINGELYGSTTDLPWGMIFPLAGDDIVRHPTQLYGALIEGFLLYTLMYLLFISYDYRLYPGRLTAIFWMIYPILRFAIEFFKEPDPTIGKIGNLLTIGQILSMILFIIGIIMWQRLYKKWQKTC